MYENQLKNVTQMQWNISWQLLTKIFMLNLLGCTGVTETSLLNIPLRFLFLYNKQ